jgi:hypothetical protein
MHITVPHHVLATCQVYMRATSQRDTGASRTVDDTAFNQVKSAGEVDGAASARVSPATSVGDSAVLDGYMPDVAASSARNRASPRVLKAQPDEAQVRSALLQHYLLHNKSVSLQVNEMMVIASTFMR